MSYCRYLPAFLNNRVACYAVFTYVCVCVCPAALEAQRVFGVLSFLMALCTGALSVVFALCWTSHTVRSYSNTRSLLMARQALYPTTLLLLTMTATGNRLKKYGQYLSYWAPSNVFVFYYTN